MPSVDCPFTVTACLSPNAYTLALPQRMRCSPMVPGNVDWLKQYLLDTQTGAAMQVSRQVSNQGQEGLTCLTALTAGWCVVSCATWCSRG